MASPEKIVKGSKIRYFDIIRIWVKLNDHTRDNQKKNIRICRDMIEDRGKASFTKVKVKKRLWPRKISWMRHMSSVWRK